MTFYYYCYYYHFSVGYFFDVTNFGVIYFFFFFFFFFLIKINLFNALGHGTMWNGCRWKRPNKAITDNTAANWSIQQIQRHLYITTDMLRAIFVQDPGILGPILAEFSRSSGRYHHLLFVSCFIRLVLVLYPRFFFFYGPIGRILFGDSSRV